MNNHLKTFQDKEIDLREILLSLWRGKVYVFLFSALFVFFASQHLKGIPREYLVEYRLKPVGDTEQKNSFSGLGGIASLAGIEMGSTSSNDFNIFKELISSVEVSEIILKNQKLISEIYAGEWNSSLNDFVEPTKSKLTVRIGVFKRMLTGNDELNYTPPNARRLASYISNKIRIKENKDTGFLTLSAETSKPKMLLSLISEAIEASDKIMRQRYINFSKEPLAFYKEKIRTSRSREHREALAELISKEEQKLMFASRGKYFIVEPYIDPTISLYPTAPKPKVTLLFALVLGIFTGCGVALVRSVLARNKK